MNEINKINLKMQIRKILLPIIFCLFSSLTNASEVSFGFKLGQTGLDEVIEALKAKNVQYEMTEDDCENDSKKCLRKIIINDSKYLGYKARKILYFNYTNKLRISLAQIRDDRFPRDSNSKFMQIGEKISDLLYKEGVKFKSKLNYSINFPKGQRKGTFVRNFCDFDEKKNKDFLCVTVMSLEPHSFLTVIASVADTDRLRSDVWFSSADYWRGI